MQELARTILESYIFEKKILRAGDIQTKSSEILKEKIPVFITISEWETVVGSSGRIYPIHENALEELIENTILLTKDSRFEPYLHNHERARKLHYRVDIFRDTDRRLLHHPDDIDGKTEWIILLCQKQEKVGIILPHILPETLSGEEIYHRVMQKIHLDTAHLGKWDVVLYAVKTEVYEDTI